MFSLPFAKGRLSASGGLRRIFPEMLIYSKELQSYARELRKNMTDAEVRLWARIKSRQLNGYQFYRQRIINRHIVDFYCPRLKLVIELDGGQHYSDEMAHKDKKRDEYLSNLGLKILRFTDTDVLVNTDAVLDNILENVRGFRGENPP
jgi:very-short-patch-repair endonuclease